MSWLHLKLCVHCHLMSLGHTLNSVSWVFWASLGTWSYLRAWCLMTGTNKSYWPVRMAERKAWKEKRRQENLKRVKTTGLDWAGDAISNEGRSPDMMPLNTVALFNNNKCPNQQLWMEPSAAKAEVGGNMRHLRKLLQLLGLDCWHPRYLTCANGDVSPPAALLPPSAAMVTAAGSYEHAQGECVLCFKKSDSHFYCFLLHSLTQCNSVIPPGFIIRASFVWGGGGGVCY